MDGAVIAVRNLPEVGVEPIQGVRVGSLGYVLTTRSRRPRSAPCFHNRC
jgi:hypothetical protein